LDRIKKKVARIEKIADRAFKDGPSLLGTLY
jgi:hypothetical protein